ncbi:DUF1801 domain-containing protein [Dyadobacter chenwenxiniae]|uniref:DUF1801 domain-containing protein n=1 Tax=Dyadobacter chenwenxiniae TaxID=2906456 RepID=A0A9X1TGX8_9BACT|nr:DUF1801 domain-containing protein [Dyadobacter chenwenxiniae]MCF0064557.1 DUF1801 domain-containing protein [Dyadobacter chenwenxiniae]UON84385.1 DUF1801 domain-containing protein [Dyadobacter chenwenxiniae]
MQLRDIDDFFWNKPEPAKGSLNALRALVLQFSPDVTEVWRYKMPFYNYNGKRFCYIWLEKKTGLPYLGIVDGKLLEHPNLIAEKRSRMKILLIDPHEDLPVDQINEILQMAIRASCHPYKTV